MKDEQRAGTTYKGLHHDAVLLSGLLNGAAELLNAGNTDESVACLEIACRLSRVFADSIEVKENAHKGGAE